MLWPVRLPSRKNVILIRFALDHGEYDSINDFVVDVEVFSFLFSSFHRHAQTTLLSTQVTNSRTIAWTIETWNVYTAEWQTDQMCWKIAELWKIRASRIGWHSFKDDPSTTTWPTRNLQWTNYSSPMILIQVKIQQIFLLFVVRLTLLYHKHTWYMIRKRGESWKSIQSFTGRNQTNNFNFVPSLRPISFAFPFFVVFRLVHDDDDVRIVCWMH